MGSISLQTPTVGNPNSTEDPKIANDFTILQTLLNGNIDLTNLSTALQSYVPTPAWLTYTPSWTGATLGPSIGNGTLAGAYITFGKTCVFNIYLLAGSTTNGGEGALTFGLPITSAAGLEQDVPCKLFASNNGTNWLGFAVISAASSAVAPYFPGNSSTVTLSQFLNSTVGLANTGVPSISGSFPLTTGSIFTCSGTYQTT